MKKAFSARGFPKNRTEVLAEWKTWAIFVLYFEERGD